MKKQKTKRLYFERILQSVLEFLFRNGITPSDLRQMIERQINQLDESAMFKKSKKSLGLSEVDSIYPLVLHRWYRDPALVTSAGDPKGIRLFGKYPSVESLVRSENPSGSARKIASSMRQAGIIFRESSGRYRPLSRVATFPPFHPSLVEHVSKSITRLLDTVARNAVQKGPSAKLIERFAQIPDLPNSDIRNFVKFSQAHGTAFLANMDDWLESRRATRSLRADKASSAAGVHVFAYVQTPQKRKRSANSRAARA